MKSESKQDIINRLLDELTALVEDYHQTLREDQILEVRKRIRVRIKEIHKQVLDLQSVPEKNTPA